MGEMKDVRLSAFDLMLVLAAKKSELYFSNFKILGEKLPRAWGWSRSSMKDLFEAGKKAGTNIAEQMRDKGHLRKK